MVKLLVWVNVQWLDCIVLLGKNSRNKVKLKNIDIEKVSAAIEADAGQALPGIRESLANAKAGIVGKVHTSERIAVRRRGRPVGSTQAVTKEAVKLRLDADLLPALRATGDGWQTRVNDAR
jgi:uncharacterized protein (DUF4415 family)